MRRVDVDDVESGLARTAGRGEVPLTEGANIAAIHALGLHGLFATRHRAHTDARQPACEVGYVAASVPELDTGQRAMRVYLLGHRREIRDIPVIPQCSERIGLVVRGWVDRAVLGADHAPATFRFHTAHRRERAWQRMTHAAAVRHLIEAIRRGDRTEPYRLEEGLIARFGGHFHARFHPAPSAAVVEAG